MSKQKNKSKKPQISWQELIIKGFIDLLIATVSAWIAKHLP